MPKLDKLRGLTETESPDVICIVETWLSSDVSDHELVISDYQILRRDRDRHGGGVMMYVHSSLAVHSHTCIIDAELLIVSVSLSKFSPKFCIALYYRPPSAGVDSFDCLSRNLYNLHHVGDFNVCAHSHLYTNLMYSLSPFNLIQVVESGTRANQHNVSLLDLIFVSVASFLYTCSALPPLGNSDHSGLQLVVQAKGVRRKLEGTRFLWNYSQGDYAKASHMINSTNWDMLFSTDINSSLLNWQNQFLHIMEECIPKSSLSPRRRLPWLTLTLIKKNNSLFGKKRFYYVMQKIYSCSEHSPQITEVCKEKILQKPEHIRPKTLLENSSYTDLLFLSWFMALEKPLLAKKKQMFFLFFSGSVSTRLFLL